MNKFRMIPAMVFLVTLSWSAMGWAQSDFNFEAFKPLPSQTTSTHGVAHSDVLGHLTPAFGFMLHLQDDPLQIGDGDDVQFRLVDTQLKAEISAAIGFFDFLDLGIVMPVAVYQDGQSAPDFTFNEELTSFALSDLRIVPRAKILDAEKTGGVGAAILIPLTLPTGDDTFNSDGSVRAEFRLALDYTHASGFRFVTNAGYEFRSERRVFNHVSGDTFTWGAATEVPIGSDAIMGVASVTGAVSVEGKPERDTDAKINPIEALGGAKFLLPADLMVQVAGGLGVTDGVGAPDFRVLAGLEWSPRNKDSDDDGILDRHDACPHEPGPAENDGCPWGDADDDGILDNVDACPNEPGPAENDGCPWGDADGDGVADNVDECPEEPGPAENDGCPWGDADGDGVADNVDECPEEPGPAENNGCPWGDRDGDGVLDNVDKCPDEAGSADNDGCPVRDKVRLTEKKIEILEKVYFDTSKATIKAQSFNVLDQVASVMRQYPQLKKIEVEGHTDSRGGVEYNEQLSLERARSVVQYLVNKGVDAERLEARGYGQQKPIGDNATEAGRDQNRRVEFTIVDSEPIIEEEVDSDPIIRESGE